VQSAVSSANGAAILTLTAPTDATKRRAFDALHWSYSATPTGGRLQITSGTQPSYDVDITAGGPGYLAFPPSFRGQAGQTVVVTLAAGGASVVGKVNVPNDWIE
jgi:hypothetical protein